MLTSPAFTTFGNTIQGPQGRDDNTYPVCQQRVPTIAVTITSNSVASTAHYYPEPNVLPSSTTACTSFTGDIVAPDGFGLGPIPGSEIGALSDFARACRKQYIQNSAGTPRYETQSYSFFIQDDWKVRPNLTLNLGVRYELDKPLVDSEDRVNTFRPVSSRQCFQPRLLVWYFRVTRASRDPLIRLTRTILVHASDLHGTFLGNAKIELCVPVTVCITTP